MNLVSAASSLASSVLGGNARIPNAIIYAYKTAQELQSATAPASGTGDLEKSIELPLIMEDNTDISQCYAIDWGGGTGGGTQNTAQGESAPITNFVKYEWRVQELKLNVMIDATGVHKTKVKGINYTSPDISEYVNGLRKVLYCYEPSSHQPPFLMLVWGKVFGAETSLKQGTHGAYKCVLSELKIDYEIFSAAGKPVRAKAEITLKPYIAPGARPQGNSPDLTHLIEIKHGDNLPKLCKQVYEDERYYHDIVRINNLPSAYAIKPGMQLLFPPLDKVER